MIYQRKDGKINNSLFVALVLFIVLAGALYGLYRMIADAVPDGYQWVGVVVVVMLGGPSVNWLAMLARKDIDQDNDRADKIAAAEADRLTKLADAEADAKAAYRIRAQADADKVKIEALEIQYRIEQMRLQIERTKAAPQLPPAEQPKALPATDQRRVIPLNGLRTGFWTADNGADGTLIESIVDHAADEYDRARFPDYRSYLRDWLRAQRGYGFSNDKYQLACDALAESGVADRRGNLLMDIPNAKKVISQIRHKSLSPEDAQ